VPVPYLGDVLDFEHALIRAALYGTGTTVRFHRDPAAVLGALYDGQLPESPATGTYVVEVEPT
jgi:hypothetical protein